MANYETYPFHGGQLRQIAERFQLPLTELLDFSANINPAGPPSSVLSTLRASVDDPSTLAEYPDLQQTELKRALARYAGTEERNVVVANGFVPLLETALRTLKITSCLLPVPAFVEYRKTLERAEVEIVPYTLTPPSFRYDHASMFAGQYDAILLTNPQNPTGICHDAESIRTLINDASKKNIQVLLDEAFIDYVPENSLSSAISGHQNLIVFRSVTKFHGIPGLRVAYAITNSQLSKTINDNLPPWPVTTLAARGVIAAIEDQEYAERSKSDSIQERNSLYADLAALGLEVYPSAANFLLFKLPSEIDPDKFWLYMIQAHRIVLRSCANYEGLTPGHFRAAVRTQRENKKLAVAIEETLSKLRSN